MREYEKWRAKERQHLISIGADCSRSDSGGAWIAALKWVLKHELDIGMTVCIKKELEGG